jgi:hypothetical protein
VRFHHCLRHDAEWCWLEASGKIIFDNLRLRVPTWVFTLVNARNIQWLSALAFPAPVMQVWLQGLTQETKGIKNYGI